VRRKRRGDVKCIVVKILIICESGIDLGFDLGLVGNIGCLCLRVDE